MEWGANNLEQGEEHMWSVSWVWTLESSMPETFLQSILQRARKQSKKKTHLSWNSSGAFSAWKSCGKYHLFCLFCRVFTARGDNQAQTYYIQIIHLISFWQLLVFLLLHLFQTDKCIFLWQLCKRMSLFTALMPNFQPSSFPYKIKGKYIWSRKLQINWTLHWINKILSGC